MIRHDQLPRQLADAVERLRVCAEEVDGTSALDEAALLALRAEEPAAIHVLETDATSDAARVPDPRVLGMASILPDGTVQGMVDPAYRGQGIGGRLLEAVLAERSEPAVWIHGELPASRRFLSERGFAVSRVLVRMERTAALIASADLSHSDTRELALPAFPEAVVTAFEDARDADDVLRVNGAAFADHPEQGGLDLAGLRARQRESWFDPAGLLLLRSAPEGGDLLGFVWTKHEPGAELGEIYVVGTAPAAQGRGVATTLIRAGLAHLRDRGAQTIELYVEGDNHGAIGLYRRFGFSEAARHVQMTRTAAR